MPTLTQFVLPKPVEPLPAGILLYLQQTTDGTSIRNRQVAFLPDAPVAGPIEVGASSGRGVYLFLGQAVPNEAAFVGQLRQLMTAPPFSPVRFLWIANPNVRPDLWKIVTLRSTGLVITAPSVISLGSFGIAIESGCAIAPRFDSPEFNITPANGSSAFFTARNGALRLPISRLTVTFDAGKAGAVTFSLALSKEQLDLLDIGCRYYYPFRAFGPGTLASLRYPVFDRSSATFSLDATVHPLAPLDPAATHFDFAAGTAAIPSYHRGATGIPSFLKPAAGARFVFAVRPTSTLPLAHDPYSLVPDGPFDLVTKEATPVKTHLCGIFGSEFVETDDNPSTLTFVAGQPAHAGGFDPNANENLNAPAPELTPEATTAWARLSGNGARLRYSSVPEDAGFYKILQSKLLEYYAATAAFLPAASEAEFSSPYPMVPYAGLETLGLGERKKFEVQVLSRHRREQIRLLNFQRPLPGVTQLPGVPSPPGGAPLAGLNQPAGVAGANSDVTTLTPQGLLAGFSQDHATWQTLRIAQSAKGSLAMHSIQEPLRSALLTKQQFIVISDPAAISGVLTDSTLDIDGWTFKLAPAGWPQFRTIMVIKNEQGALADLIETPARWNLASQFNSSVAATQDRLRQILQEARDAQPTNSNFDFFVKTVLIDVNWNGVLFLHAPISPAEIEDLKGFAAGIDNSHFFAHHIGVNQTPVSEENLDAQLHSSLFGLIDYNDTPGAGSAFAPFDFRVKLLRVLFKNSHVSDFSCTVALTVNELFGAPTTTLGQVIELDGIFEKHDNGNVLRLESPAGDRVFALNDQVLDTVAITKTHFSTRVPGPGGGSGEVEARFTFFGSLAFKPLQIDDATPFDVFSYSKLAFSGLAVRMIFPEADPPRRRFEFDASEMVINGASSIVRDKSLARHFPLKLSQFMASKGDSKPPAKLGYAAVSIPLPHVKIDAPWYGFTYDLNLGTLGSLAADEGIVARLIVLWSPASAGSPPLFVGLKIPGLTGGGDQFTLFGVLKLKMHSLDLTVQADGTKVGYQLLLNGISLSLFGKAIPPGASFDFQVFGDTRGDATSDSLGWYGAFNPPQE